jgi:hypothetical protein
LVAVYYQGAAGARRTDTDAKLLEELRALGYLD